MGKGILKDFWIKLISVAIAIALWLYVNNDKQREVAFNISPTFCRMDPLGTPISSRTVIKEIIPDKIKIVLRGKFTTILFLNSKTIKLNLSPVVSKGDTEVFCDISNKDIIVQLGIEVTKIEPSRVLVRIR